MAQTRQRLEKLLALHGQLGRAHEARRGAHLAAASAAREEGETLRARFDAPGSLSALFPELYHQHIDRARAREAEAEAKAANEAAAIARLAARERLINQRLAEITRWEDRMRDEQVVLAWVESRIASGR